MAANSHRRRFQFSLRTLLIGITLLAIPCGYVGWQAKIVRERKAILDRVRADGGYTTDFRDNSVPPPPPWIRRILGDETVEVIIVPASTDPQSLADIKSVFHGVIIARNFGDRAVAVP